MTSFRIRGGRGDGSVQVSSSRRLRPRLTTVAAVAAAVAAVAIGCTLVAAAVWRGCGCGCGCGCSPRCPSPSPSSLVPSSCLRRSLRCAPQPHYERRLCCDRPWRDPPAAMAQGSCRTVAKNCGFVSLSSRARRDARRDQLRLSMHRRKRQPIGRPNRFLPDRDVRISRAATPSSNAV